MTKAERIRALYDGKRSTSEIAAMVGCLPQYVRVVARQRVPGGSNPDLKWRERNPEVGKAARRKWHKKNVDHCREYSRKWERSNKEWRRAYVASRRAKRRAEAEAHT